MDNQHSERLPRKEPDASPSPKGGPSRMKSELAGLTFEEQQAKVKPPELASKKVEKVQKATIVQLVAGDVVQLKPVRTHADIKKQVPETEMGPYYYVPEAKKFIPSGIGRLTAEKLWEACLKTTSYGPETATIPDVAKADKDKRVELARKKLLGSKSDTAFKKIIAHDGGNSPRPFVSVAAEAGHNGHAHCHDRHVFGMGTINGVTALATRAGFRRPFACSDDGIASAFKNVGAANTHVASAITDELAANWTTWRVKIAQGKGLKEIAVALAGNVTALQKKDNPKGTAYDESEMPNYRGGDGYRPLYPDEPLWETNKQVADKDEKPKYTDTLKNNPLTVDATSQLANVCVVLRADENVPGGWYLLTAYPVV